MKILLLLSVFIISTCGLVYELISAALASYLLGDSITQFSIVIGVYLFSMGLGSYLSRYTKKNLVSTFVQVEILIGLIGGGSAALLFLCFEQVSSFRLLLYALVGITGVLVGFEIPLLMRILKEEFEFKDLVSKIFTYDYVGALIASLLFPLVLVPHLGLVRSAFLFGIFNVLVALGTLAYFEAQVNALKLRRTGAIVSLLSLCVGFAFSEKLVHIAETATYPEPILYAKSSPYQRLVITEGKKEIKLYLNGNLQFSSKDEYRYHEALVHVGMANLKSPERILILGGGDGLAIREVLKYPSVKSIELIDLDPEVTKLFSTHETLRKLNHDAFHSPLVHVVHQDAFEWLKRNKDLYDFVIVDFPDPSNYSVGKLFTTTFYKYLYAAVQPLGAAVIQSTSPYFARRSYWCVDATLKEANFHTVPYHAYIPSFGEWGFVLASKEPMKINGHFEKDLRYVNQSTLASMLSFPPDMDYLKAEPNHLNSQILVRYFEEEWSQHMQH